MPLEWGQTDPRLTCSLMYEDKLLLTIRVERLQEGNRTFGQKPKSRCHAVLQGAANRRSRRGRQRLCDMDAHRHYIETRLDEQMLFAAWATHALTVDDGRLMIKMKRVDLVNCDAAFGSIQLFCEPAHRTQKATILWTRSPTVGDLRKGVTISAHPRCRFPTMPVTRARFSLLTEWEVSEARKPVFRPPPRDPSTMSPRASLNFRRPIRRRAGRKAAM